MSDTKAGPAERTYDTLHHRRYVQTVYADAALAEKDARVVELEAENERLKCCGNCSFWLAVLEDCPIKDEPHADRFDPCHFTPSRWAERSAP